MGAEGSKVADDEGGLTTGCRTSPSDGAVSVGLQAERPSRNSLSGRTPLVNGGSLPPGVEKLTPSQKAGLAQGGGPRIISSGAGLHGTSDNSPSKRGSTVAPAGGQAPLVSARRATASHILSNTTSSLPDRPSPARSSASNMGPAYQTSIRHHRRPVTASSAISRGTPGHDPLSAAVAQLLTADAVAVQSAEEKMEETKAELTDKLNNFIKRTAVKDVAALPSFKLANAHATRAAAPKDSAKSRGWLTQFSANRQAMLEKLQNKEKYVAPLTQEEVGDRVEGSLGDAYQTFGQYQGAVHSVMQGGVTDELLSNFLFDEEHERSLTTYDKWRVVRHAAEQVLSVYANRSNAKWIEAESWTAPKVVDANALSGSAYANAVDGSITQGHVGLLFIDDGRLAEMADEEASALVATDLWAALKELAPHKVPTGQRLERLSVAGRHLLHAAVSVEMWYGAAALRNLKVVVAVDSDQEQFLIGELQHWSFFGLHHTNVVILPLPRFHGFAQDQRTGRLAHVKGSVRLMLGTGYAMFLLNSAAEAYILSADASEPLCLQGSVCEWLKENKVSWLFTGLFSDIERLRPEAMFDVDLLATAMFAAERQGANMSMEVVLGDSERDVRTYDSVVLGRGSSSLSNGGSSGPGEALSGPSGNVTLRAAAMRTVRSYQILQSQVHNPHGFYVSAHRYCFRVAALPKLLSDASAFHADVRLHGFYAYATFDIGDITTFKDANCACIMSQGLKGPVMNEAVYGKQWLIYAASVLESQDKVNEFRAKAIACVQYDSSASRTSNSKKVLVVAQPKFKDKAGFNVVLVLTADHTRTCHAALKMARLFVHNIIDRLHVVVVTNENDSKDKIRAMMDEMVDKELEYNGQLIRHTLARKESTPVGDTVRALVVKVEGHLVVAPSERLCGPSRDLGQISASLAYQLARTLTEAPILVVKANTCGKLLAGCMHQQQQPPSHTGARELLRVMIHLDSTQVAPVVEAISSHMAAAQGDSLLLAKTLAFERSGHLSMRSRRVFVQARMAVAGAVKMEERAYAGVGAAELPKAVEVEGVDMLVVSVPGEMGISKEVEDLLKTAKTSVYIYRAESTAPPQSTQHISYNISTSEPAPARYQ